MRPPVFQSPFAIMCFVFAVLIWLRILVVLLHYLFHILFQLLAFALVLLNAWAFAFALLSVVVVCVKRLTSASATAQIGAFLPD